MAGFCFGPVMSRRLGLSLGVNVLGEVKHCTFNCVYCEVGPTIGNSLVPPDFKVNISPIGFREEISRILQNLRRDLDSVTFGYNGEPTLNPHLGEFLSITREIQNELAPTPTDKFPIMSVFTNSTTLQDSNIRQTLSQFDLIIAKLDVGTRAGLCHVNNPNAAVPPVEEIVRSLTILKNELHTGHKLAIQSLFYATLRQGMPIEVNIPAWVDRISTIQPDIVQIYSVARQTADPRVIPVTREVLTQIKNQLMRRFKEGSNIDVRVF